MSNKLDTVAKVAVFLAVVVFAVSITTPTGAFSTANLSRPSAVDLGSGGDESLIGLDTTDRVSVACSERLVTVTNNFDDSAQFAVTILEDRDGELILEESSPSQTSVSFTLTPGESQVVYITGVRGPIWDDVEFDITATTSDAEITVSKRVPKVPGNEDEDEDDRNWGGDGCGDEEESDGEDNGGPPPWAGGPDD